MRELSKILGDYENSFLNRSIKLSIELLSEFSLPKLLTILLVILSVSEKSILNFFKDSKMRSFG